MGQIIIIIIIV